MEPFSIDRLNVREKPKNGLAFFDLSFRAFNRKTQPIFIDGTRGDYPKLKKNLRNDANIITPKKGANATARLLVERMIRLRNPKKDVAVKKIH
jgi:hypothetical protein